MERNEEMMKANRAAVLRFNKDVIERGDEAAFRDLMSPEFINRSAPPGSPSGSDGMLYFFSHILRPALPDLHVEVHDQMAEGDKVATRKTIHGTHRGELFGVKPTNKRVAIDVIDVVRLKNGRYAEHWGLTTMESVLASLHNDTSKEID